MPIKLLRLAQNNLQLFCLFLKKVSPNPGWLQNSGLCCSNIFEKTGHINPSHSPPLFLLQTMLRHYLLLLG
jgi:hypothetical protein